MDTVVIVAVTVLGILFVASFGSLIYICCRRYLTKRQPLLNEEDHTLSQTVLSFDDDAVHDTSSSLELDCTVACDDGTIRQLLETEEWANNVYGVIPHCIAILKMCREVTEKLVAIAMENNHQNIYPSKRSEIMMVAKCISPRVDDVMRAISPPINPKVLETCSVALIYSVQHLALLLRNSWQSHISLDWIDAAMDNMTQHLMILRNVHLQEKESDLKHPSDVMKKELSDGDSDISSLESTSQSSKL